MPPWRCLQSPGPYVDDGVGDRGLKGGSHCWCWASCPGKGLAGAAEAAPGKDLARETYFVHLLYVVSVFGVALTVLRLRLLPFALLSVASARGSECPCTSKGYKGVPLL